MNEEETMEEEDTQIKCVSCESFKLSLFNIDYDEKEDYSIQIICQNCGLLQFLVLERKILSVNFETKPIKKNASK